MSWSPPSGELKFNVDGAAKGELGPARIGGVLRNSDGVVLTCFLNMEVVCSIPKQRWWLY